MSNFISFLLESSVVVICMPLFLILAHFAPRFVVATQLRLQQLLSWGKITNEALVLLLGSHLMSTLLAILQAAMHLLQGCHQQLQPLK